MLSATSPTYTTMMERLGEVNSGRLAAMLHHNFAIALMNNTFTSKQVAFIWNDIGLNVVRGGFLREAFWQELNAEFPAYVTALYVNYPEFAAEVVDAATTSNL